MSPWRFVVTFGIVSLLADWVYEGARSIIGPYLLTLGASAAVVGTVAGAGEFIGYGFRVVSGYLAQRNRHYWRWTIAGYALTVASVPLIGTTHVLVIALLLYGTERLGKAVRSPAKDTLLSYASAQTGRGKAFGVHQALDQFGAVLGPLMLGAVLSWRHGDYRLAFGLLAIPGAAVIAMLFYLQSRVPDPRLFETAEVHAKPAVAAPLVADGRQPSILHPGLPPLLWRYMAAVGLLSGGIASFPLISFHAINQGLVHGAQIPVLFALAMFTDGVSGLVVGRIYDRRGARVLLALPLASSLSAVIFAHSAPLVWVGVAVWGLINGVMDSTVKALVTELVDSDRRPAAFGWLALVRGIGLLFAGAALGFTYDVSIGLFQIAIVVINLAGLYVLASVLREVARADLAR